MEHPRIRWKNVGRLAAGIGAGGLLLGVLPGVLEPADAPPLPRDVGLRAAYAATSTPEREASRARSHDSERRARRSPPRRPPAERREEPAARKPAPRPAAGDAQPPPAIVPAPIPASAPAPAATSPPVVQQVAPAQPPPPEPPGGTEGSPGPPHSPEAPSGPSPFSFEH